MKCTNCGAALDHAATFCGYCGTAVTKVSAVAAAPVNSFAQPALAVASANAGSKGTPSEPLSQIWKERFALIEKGGGAKLPKFRELTFGERFKLLNWWAFFFGPFYYLAKGMPKRGVVLAALCIAAAVVLEAVFDSIGTNLLAAAVFAGRANFDFYKKVVLNDNEWW